MEAKGNPAQLANQYRSEDGREVARRSPEGSKAIRMKGDSMDQQKAYLTSQAKLEALRLALSALAQDPHRDGKEDGRRAISLANAFYKFLKP
jgi:hypothetical protein